MKRPKKTIIKRAVIAAAILAVAVLLINPVRTLVGVVQMAHDDDNYMYVHDFNAYYNDYRVIAEVALRYKYLLSNEKGYYLMYDFKGGRCCLFLIDDSANEKNSEIKLSAQEEKCLNRVNESFGEGVSLDGIRVYQNRVGFEIEQDQYAIVYTINDSKPTFLALPGEHQSIKVVKIRSHWYHVKGNQSML